MLLVSFVFTSAVLLCLTITRNTFRLKQTWRSLLVLISPWSAPLRSLSRLSNVSSANSKYPLRRISNPLFPFMLRMVPVLRWNIRLRPRLKQRRCNRRASIASNLGVRGQTAISYLPQGRCLSNSCSTITSGCILRRQHTRTRGATRSPKHSHTSIARCSRLQEGMVSPFLLDPLPGDSLFNRISRIDAVVRDPRRSTAAVGKFISRCKGSVQCSCIHLRSGGP